MAGSLNGGRRVLPSTRPASHLRLYQRRPSSCRRGVSSLANRKFNAKFNSFSSDQLPQTFQRKGTTPKQPLTTPFTQTLG
ncbi:hypothetical protein E2C01_098386 [Portunus trituberculatus]|uniref:Uncharacterized protein n=1 Tax=Portunus trituberculatus TaxID=210409 RepID=A0A5B7K2V3_PORTR|nr:hypothetical protein [Portunus trituberculatus]